MIHLKDAFTALFTLKNHAFPKREIYIPSHVHDSFGVTGANSLPPQNLVAKFFEQRNLRV